MKKIFLLSGFVVLLLISTANAQLKAFSKSKKIAFINRLAFEDKRFGIEKYVKAIEAVNNEGFISEQIDSAKRKAAYEKRYQLLVAPVENEISAFLKELEEVNNLEILDFVELDQKGQILSVDDRLDITAEAVSMINRFFKEKRRPLLTLIVPEMKLTAINTEAFADEKTGIAKYKEKTAQSEALTKMQIGREIRAFSEKRGFGVVFDSSRRSSARLQNFQIQDITKDFISYYNQLNP